MPICMQACNEKAKKIDNMRFRLLKKITIKMLVLLFTAIHGMEKQIDFLKVDGILVESERPGSLKFNIAWLLALGKIRPRELLLPNDLIELIKQFKLLLSCNIISQNQLKFIINFVNNPHFEFDSYFQNIISKYNYISFSGQSDKQNVLNHILLLACQAGDIGLVSLMINLGADINARSTNGCTALIEASKFGYGSVVDILLNGGVDVNAEDNSGESTLIWATINGHKGIVKKLLKSNVDVKSKDKKGNTALMWAVYYERKKIVKMLIKSNADISAQNNSGNTALTVARLRANKEIVKLLIKSGA